MTQAWKPAFFVLLAVLLGVSGTAAYLVLDQAVSLTYMKEGYQDTEEDLRVLMKLLPEVSRSADRKDFLAVLRRQNPEALITDDGEGIGIGFLGFTFDPQGRLREVNQR
jgi:hypothetical protein